MRLRKLALLAPMRRATTVPIPSRGPAGTTRVKFPCWANPAQWGKYRSIQGHPLLDCHDFGLLAVADGPEVDHPLVAGRLLAQHRSVVRCLQHKGIAAIFWIMD